MGRERQQHDSRVNFRDLEDDRWDEALEDSLLRGYGGTPWGTPMLWDDDEVVEQSVEESRAPHVSHGNVFEDLAERYDDTPDFWKFRLLPLVPVFVYDGMQYNGCRHSFIRGGDFYGKGHTVAQNFRMFSSGSLKAENPAFPKTQLDHATARVRGELYGVPPETIIDIDNFYVGNGKYKRIEQLIVAEDQEALPGDRVALAQRGFSRWKNRTVLRAFMYVGRFGAWENSGLISRNRIEYTSENTPSILLKKKFYEFDAKTSVYGSNIFGPRGRGSNWNDPDRDVY